MEDPRLNRSKSPQYSDNEEDNTMTAENSTEVLQKSQDFSQQTESKIVNRYKVRYTE